MAKRDSAPFVIQKLSGAAGDSRKCGNMWVDITNPDNDGQCFVSTAECESWIKKNAQQFGSEQPTLRIVQVKRCMKMEIEMKVAVSFEEMQLPTIIEQETETDGEEEK